MSLALKQDEFDFISSYLKQRSGLALSQDKVYLLESRLQPIARAQNLATVNELIAKLKSGGIGKAVETEIIESMTTNESMFFRDSKPFEYFTKLMIPRIRAATPTLPRLRIWSAACSNGQEPYSIAITFKENEASLGGMGCDIFATDIADKVIERAKQGHYTQFEVQRGLPINLLLKYFKQLPENIWEVHAPIRQMVRYQNVNLLSPITNLGTFDIIFCRNVLIYFDEATKADILNRMCSILSPAGCIVLGGAETVLGITDKLKPLDDARGVFIKA